MKTHGAGKIHGKLCEKFGQLVTERRPSWQIVITLPSLQLDFSENVNVKLSTGIRFNETNNLQNIIFVILRNKT